MKYLINYTETFTGQIEIEADSKEQANDIVCRRIDNETLIPSQVYDSHEITIGFAEQIKG